MKKLVMTGVVLACAASIVSAQTVTSANMVGYVKGTVLSADFEMLAPQFTAGDAGGITLGDAFSGMNHLDEVLVWKVGVGGYDLYRYWGTPYNAWYERDDETEANDVLIPEGSSVWGSSSAGATFLMSGEVPSVGSITNTLVVGFNMVAKPYPTSMRLGDIPLVALTDQDEALVWGAGGGGYDLYRYWGAPYFQWYERDDETEANDVIISVGQGFWLNSAVGGDLILDKQY